MTTTASRVVREPSLPGDIALALDEVLENGGGAPMLERAADRITRELLTVVPRGYRSSPLEAQWMDAALALVAEIDGSGTARVRS